MAETTRLLLPRVRVFMAGAVSGDWQPAGSRPAALSGDREQRPPNHRAGTRGARPCRDRNAAIATGPDHWGRLPWRSSRSEEHTSELQSQSNLVCRLLLEKKRKKY